MEKMQATGNGVKCTHTCDSALEMIEHIHNLLIAW
jgi:hypothetical protein